MPKRRAVVTANVRERDLGSFVAEVQRRVRNEVTGSGVGPDQTTHLGSRYTFRF
jgi:hypothetical protein